MIQTAFLGPGAQLLSRQEGGVNSTLLGGIHLLDGTSRLAYVKRLPPKRVVNELVAAELARLLGFNVPESFIVLVPKTEYPLLAKEAPGQHLVCFGSQAVFGGQLARRLDLSDPQVAHWFFTTLKEWQRIVVFDAWVANADRHRANILFTATLQLWLIDHDLAFLGDAPFATLDAAARTTNRFIELHEAAIALRLRHEPVDAVAPQVMEQASIVDIPGALSDCLAASFMPASEHDALALYLSNRIAHLQRLVAEAVGVSVLDFRR